MTTAVSWVRLLTAGVLLNTSLLAPYWLSGAGRAPWLALEAVLLAGLFAALPRTRRTRWLAALAASLWVLLALMAMGDATTRMSLARPLNLYLDIALLGAVHHLLSGTLSVGAIGAALLLVGFTMIAVLLAVVLARLLTQLGPRPGQRAVALRLGLLLLAGTAIGLAARPDTFGPYVAQPARVLVLEQRDQARRMWAEHERFAAEAAATPASYALLPGLLQKLQGTDVLLAFIESYGVSAVHDPRFSPLVVPRLGELGERMHDAGLHVVSGTLEAPVQGGQSWLARGTLLSGLWLDNQLRYDLLLAAGRETLVHDFRRAGYRTAAVMPAITMPWPEGRRLGHEQIFAFADMEYAGPPLNWVTMPDQYTWSFVERRLRAGADPQPLFAEIALISSHAPWTPILPVLDWDRVGDGSLFAPWESADQPPAELWRDPHRVRLYYALAVDYALHAMLGFAERNVDERTLLIALGDHQPAPLITGEGASRDVPVHVISGDPALLQPFLDWGFVPGPWPEPGSESVAMPAFRDWFLRAFSEDGAATEADAAR